MLDIETERLLCQYVIGCTAAVFVLGAAILAGIESARQWTAEIAKTPREPWESMHKEFKRF